MIAAAVAVWVIALILIHVERASWWVFGAAVGVCGFAAAWRRERELAGTRASMIVAAAAIAAVSLSVAWQVPGRDAMAAAIGRSVTIDALVTSNSSAPSNGRVWVEVLASLEGASPVPMRVALESTKQAPFGATIRIFGELGEPWGPGAIVASMSTHRAPETLSNGGALLNIAAGLRDGFIERASRLPGGGAELLPGLAVGDTRAVTPLVEEAMLQSGLSHLTAVSGANCAIVTAIAFGAAALLRAPRSLRVAVALLSLALFVILVTPEPSVVRASVMAAIALLALVLGRPGAGGAALGLAVVVILVIDPWLALSAGFALSVASTTALLYLMAPLARGLTRWLPKPLAWAIAAPLAAQLACGPIIALFAEEQSLVSVLANMLAAPAAPIVTVVGMIGCLLAPLPLLADFAVATAWPAAQWIASTAEIAASLPTAVIPVTPGPVTALVVAVVSVSIALVIIKPQGGRFLPAVRPAAALILAGMCAWGLAGLVSRVLVAPLTIPADWVIAACDVGQGDAFVVRDSDAVAVIDTGEDPQLLAECLHLLSIQRVDLLVLTHFDLDHVGGAGALAGRVDTVLYAESDAVDNADLLETLRAGGATLAPATAGMSGWLGTLEFRVLWPRAGERVFEPGNAQSIVTEFSGVGFPTFLALGDLGEGEQRALLSANPHLRAAVVKVSHHGSADQYGGLYETLGASIALIGVGAENTHGHPRPETLETLSALDAQTFRTDRNGATLIIPGENGALKVWTERNGQEASEVPGSLKR